MRSPTKRGVRCCTRARADSPRRRVAAAPGLRRGIPWRRVRGHGLDRPRSRARASVERRARRYYACCSGRIGAATLLLDLGADVNGPQPPSGTTPLHIACLAGQLDVVKLCLDRGAEIDRFTSYGTTALYSASRNGDAATVRLLLARGATYNAGPSQLTRIPHDAARANGHKATAAWLERVHTVGWTCYLSEPRYGLVVLRALVAEGRAERRRAFSNTERLLDFLFPGKSGEQPSRAKQARRFKQRLPDDLFSLVAQYYWGGEQERQPRL